MSSPGDPLQFAALLRRHRLIAGLSQEALAGRSGLSIDAIRAFERGRRRTPRPETLSLLMTALDLSQAERISLVTAVGTPNAPQAPLHRVSGAIRSMRGLPHPPGPLIGREREMVAAGRLLLDNDGRLLTLLGPGGVGKTRLALELLIRHENAFDNGAAFVGLAPLRDPGLMPAAIADALGLRETGQQDIWAALLSHMRDRRILLALDNFEQIVDAASLVGELLLACPHLSILVTSRRALNVRAEQRFPVQPLATVPAPASGLDNPHLSDIPAVRLFVARAKAMQPDFHLEAANLETVASICDRLDGLPLAIELAAARVALLSPVDLLKRLIRCLPVLTDGARDLPHRQRTLRATIDWSYELLTESERTLFRRLSVFARGCTLEAAIRVCFAGEFHDEEAMRLLSSLVEGSLLRLKDDGRGDPRIFMLETVREYAGERLEESDEVVAVRRRHAMYFLTLAERAESDLGSPNQSPALEQLEGELDNLRAALTFGFDEDPTIGLRLAASLWQFWWSRGYLTEGRDWLERFLVNAVSSSSPIAQARGLLGAGCLAMQQSDWQAARIHLEAGLAVARSQTDVPLTAWFLRELGSLFSYASSYWRAIPLLEEALSTSRTLDDSPGLEASLLSLARILRSHGEYDHARTLLNEALSAALARHSSRSIAAVRVVLGDIARYESNLTEATAEYTIGLTAAREAGHKSVEAWALGGLGQVALWQGDLPAATALLERALDMYRELGAIFNTGFVLHVLGFASLRAEDNIRAADLLREALTLRWQLGVVADSADSLELLAIIAVRWGRSRLAVRLFAGADTARNVTGALLPPIERAFKDEAIHSLRLTLGEVPFKEFWEEGREMPLESTVDEALTLTIQKTPTTPL